MPRQSNQWETRDAIDDAIQIKLAEEGNLTTNKYAEILGLFYEANTDLLGNANESLYEISETLKDILKKISPPGGNGSSGGTGGSPSGGGGGGGPSNTPASEQATNNLTDAIKGLDKRMQGMSDDYGKVAKLMGFLNTSLTDFVKSTKNISPTSSAGAGGIIGAGAGALVGAPLIGAAVGAAVGFIGGMLSGDKEVGQLVRMNDPILVGNWDTSGIPELTNQVVHLGTILNEINATLGGAFIGGLAQPEEKGYISSFITWWGNFLEPEEVHELGEGKSQLALSDQLEELVISIQNIETFYGPMLASIHGAEIELIDVRTNVREANLAINELGKAMIELGHSLTGNDWSLMTDKFGNVIDAEFSVVQKIEQLHQAMMPVLDKIAENTGKSEGFKESKDQPLPRWPKGTKSPAGKGGIMSREDAEEAWGNTDFDFDEFLDDQERLATGGEIDGEGPTGGDGVNIVAEKGEFIVKKSAAQKNKSLLDSLNSEHFAGGGSVGGGASDVAMVEVPELMIPFKILTGSVLAASSALGDFVNQMIPFVQAISPSTVQMWNTQVANLTATIGTSFIDILSTLTDMVRKMGGIMLPIAQELQPIFASLGDMIQASILPMMKLFATIGMSIIPTISSVFGTLKNIVLETVKSFIILATMFARMFGFNDFIDRLIGNLNRPDSAGATAVGSASITDFAGISREIAIAAAQASASGGAAGPASTTDILTDIMGELEAIRGETVDQLANRLNGMIEEFWRQLSELWNNTYEAMSVWFTTELSPLMQRVLADMWADVQRWADSKWPGISQNLGPAIQNVIGSPREAILDAWDYWTDPRNNPFGF